MLRITKVQENGTNVVLKLEGKITAQWASLLDGECRTILRQKKAVHLDYANVDFMDEQGMEVLKNLPRKNVTLIGAPEYVTELLQIGGRS